MGKKIAITAAIAGSSLTKEDHPAAPYHSPGNCRSGGGVLPGRSRKFAHVHVRDPETGKPAFDKGLYKETLDSIRQRCNIILNPSTSGLAVEGGDVTARRLEPITLSRTCVPSTWVGQHARPGALQPAPVGGGGSSMRPGARRKDEIEIFEVGTHRSSLDFIQRGLIPAPPYFHFCMGVGWGMEGFRKPALPEEQASGWRPLGRHGGWEVPAHYDHHGDPARSGPGPSGVRRQHLSPRRDQGEEQCGAGRHGRPPDPEPGSRGGDSRRGTGDAWHEAVNRAALKIGPRGARVREGAWRREVAPTL